MRVWQESGDGVVDEVAEEAGAQRARQEPGSINGEPELVRVRITDRTGPIELPARTLHIQDAPCSLLGCAARLFCGL